MLELGTLLERCSQGDELAWEALVRRFQSRIYALAFHYLRNEEEARDLAQEIFIKVYHNIGDIRNAETFVPWMLRLGRNCCIDRIRRIKARPPAFDVQVDEGVELAGTGSDPEEAAGMEQRRDLVYRAMEGMSDINREMILLKEIQGMNLQEISEMLEVPLGTVKSRSMRARLELARNVLALDPSYGT